MNSLFDNVARTLANPMPRRRALRAIFASLLGVGTPGILFGACTDTCCTAGNCPSGAPCQNNNDCASRLCATCHNGGGKACISTTTSCCTVGASNTGTGSVLCTSANPCYCSTGACSSSMGTACTNASCTQ